MPQRSPRRQRPGPARPRRPRDPARRVAYDVVRAVDERAAYANLMLPALLRERGLTGRDAALATELTYGTLRGRGTYDAVLGLCSDRPVAKIDLRVGGANLIVMKSPEGQEMPNRGTYLEIVPNEKLVFTDAYTGDWQPSGKPFMTVVLTFKDEGGKTRYLARCRHWNRHDRDTHEQMGFHQGWGICADQLEALAKSI